MVLAFLRAPCPFATAKPPSEGGALGAFSACPTRAGTKEGATPNAQRATDDPSGSTAGPALRGAYRSDPIDFVVCEAATSPLYPTQLRLAGWPRISPSIAISGILNSESRYVDKLRRPDGGVAPPGARMTQVGVCSLDDRIRPSAPAFAVFPRCISTMVHGEGIRGILRAARCTTGEIWGRLWNWRKRRRPVSLPSAGFSRTLRVNYAECRMPRCGTWTVAGPPRRRPPSRILPRHRNENCTRSLHPPRDSTSAATHIHQNNDEEAQEWRKEQARTRARASRSLRVVCHAGAEG